MSALAEALVAAQRRALTALEKAYVAGAHTADQTFELLDSIGATDKVDQTHLLAALTVIRSLGAEAPAETGAAKQPEPASDKQLSYVARLVKEQHLQAPDLPLTSVQASEIIDTIKAGTYDAAKWTVPF